MVVNFTFLRQQESRDKDIKKKLDIAVLGEKKRLYSVFFKSTQQNRSKETIFCLLLCPVFLRDYCWISSFVFSPWHNSSKLSSAHLA